MPPVQEKPPLTYASVSKALNAFVTARDGEWSGIPMPLPGLGLHVAPGHPMAEKFAEMQRIVDEGRERDGVKACSADDMGWRVVNQWRGRSRTGVTGTVVVMRHEDGRIRGGLIPSLPGRNRFLFGPFDTMDAWDLDTELTAMEKLATLVTERMFKAYVLTGQFIERSKRSGLVYFFRRLHPTIVLTASGQRGDYFGDAEPDEADEPPEMTILACLCLHPLAYYEQTFCGAMVPTDDVIAHLLLMRGDEHMFWKRANHHHPLEPESGL